MTQKLVSRLHEMIQKTLRFVERDRTNIVTASLLIILFSFLRVFFEKTFLTEGNIVEGRIFIDSVYNWAHITAFYTAVFLGGILIISFFSKQKVRKVANVVLWGFWLIITPPLIDYFIFGLTDPSLYEYAPIIDIMTNITTLFGYSTATWGVKIMILTILILLIPYTTTLIYYRTKSIIEAAARTLLILFSMFLFMAVMGSVYLAIVVENFPTNTIKIIYLEMFLFISIFLAAVLVDLSNKKILPYFLSKFRPYQLTRFILIGLFGLTAAGKFMFINGELIPSNSLPYILLCLLTLAFGWQFTSMLNDVYDGEISKVEKKKSLSILTKSQYTHTAVLMAVISFGMSVLLSPISMLLTLACILLALAYSIPPLRLKRNVFAGSTVIGLGSVCAFLVGYFTTDEILMTGEITGAVIGNYILWVPYSPPSLTPIAIAASIIIFFATFLFYLYSAKKKN